MDGLANGRISMKHLLVVLLCVVAALSVTEARRSRRSVSVILRATPKVAVEGLTPQLKLDCRPPPTVDDVLMAVLIHLEKEDENGTVSLVASQRINALEVAEDNRTTVDAHLQSSASDPSSYLSVTIKEPIRSDTATYKCRFAYIDVSWNVHSLGSVSNVSVTDLPPPDYIPEVGCECDQIWAEIDNLRATLVAENKQLKAQKGVAVAGAPLDDSCRVSFSARFETRHGYQIYPDQTAVFDYAISNKGDAYDTTTGYFTAPCSGQYFFSATLRSHQDLDAGYVDGVIMVNGEAKARTSVFLNDASVNFQSASNGVVLSLEQGSQVSVLVKTTSSGEFVGEEYSIFSGFYLSP